MNVVSGDRLWIKDTPIPKQYKYLDSNIECDVAVIGAGVIGALCAFHFAEAGLHTVLVDRGVAGYLSTSASTAILQYEVDTDLIGLGGMIGMEKATQSFKLFEKAVYDIEKIIKGFDNKCEFRTRQSLYYSFNPGDIDYMRREFELRKAGGLNVEFIDRAAAQKLFSFRVEAGILSHSGAGDINPYAFCHELISNAEEKSAQIFENTEIIKLEPSSSSVVLTTNIDRKIRARKVVIASGYEAVRLIREKIASFSRTFTIATSPVKSFNGWPNQCIIRDNRSAYNYLRTSFDSRILMGGEDVDLGSRNSNIALLKNMDKFVSERYCLLENKLKSYFPAIDDIKAEYAFNGIFGTTKDGLPYIGEHSKYPNCYFSLCYGSNGIVYGVLAAQLIRDMIVGKTPRESELFRFGR
ncbi:MAG: FAD-binding oxidoreductase [Clostridia bacterium]|nr:FAD-binding oxidoreductase [Clostridia bacterium]